jgi:putative transposase
VTCAPKTPPDLCRVRPTKGRTNEGRIYGRTDHTLPGRVLHSNVPKGAIIKEQESGEKTADVCRRHGIHWPSGYRKAMSREAVPRRSTNTNRSMAGWNLLTQSDCGLWRTRTASSKSCWPNRCWTTRCCEISIQKNGDACCEAGSGGSHVRSARCESATARQAIA